MHKFLLFCFSLVLITGFSNSASADIIGGVEFPDGPVSFADFVYSYNPVIKSGEPTVPYRNASNALGTPDFDGEWAEDVEFVSLGDGGSITVQFLNNSLTGSGNTNLDLWIFEVGPDVEDTYVEISKDALTWFSVGKVAGATSGIDIDAYGFGTSDFFSYVRLTDDPELDGQSGATVGADIDAIGAISSAPPVNPVPEPATLLLFGFGLAGIAGLRKKFKKL